MKKQLNEYGVPDWAASLVASFEKQCADAGHYWADDPSGLGQYCQGCGALRQHEENKK